MTYQEAKLKAARYTSDKNIYNGHGIGGMQIEKAVIYPTDDYDNAIKSIESSSPVAISKNNNDQDWSIIIVLNQTPGEHGSAPGKSYVSEEIFKNLSVLNLK